MNRIVTAILCLLLCFVGVTVPTASAAVLSTSSRSSLVSCLQQEYLAYDTYADIYTRYPSLTAVKAVALDDVKMIGTLDGLCSKYRVTVPADAEASAAKNIADTVTDIAEADPVAISLEKSTATLMKSLILVSRNADITAAENIIATSSLGSHISAFTTEEASLVTTPTTPSVPTTPSTPSTPTTPTTTGQTLTGSGIPEATLGNVGDLYIDTTSHNIYGPGIGADGLANTQVGGPNGTPGRIVSIRFRASATSALTNLRFYKQGNTGYAGGTGGSLNISIQADDGTPSHLPTGVALASQTVVCSSTGSEPGKLVTFSSPATLIAGNLYHVVFANVDPAPATNYVSVNSTVTVTPTTPRQPLFPDTDWALLVKDTGIDWKVRPEFTPIMSLTYANSQTAGMGYMERCYSDYSVDGTAEVRETFTVTGGDRTVSTVGARLRRITGTGDLTLTVATSTGAVVGSATISASSLPTGTYGSWAAAAFATPFKLTSGATYSFVLTTSSGTTYSVLAFRKGIAYLQPTGSYFKDGHAQQSSNGTSWADVAGDPGEYDLQFYFDNVTSALYGPKTSTGWGLKSLITK